MGLGGSVESVLRRLGQGQSDIARFCFEQSVAQIRGHDAHRLLLSLSLFTSDASREALGIVAGLVDDEFGRDMGIEDLLRLSLINKEGDRFNLLPLTRSFVQNEANMETEWMGNAAERWGNFFYKLIGTLAGISQEWRGHDLAEIELANILSFIDQLVSNLRYQQTSDSNRTIHPSSFKNAQLVVYSSNYVARTCRIRGYWNNCEDLCQIAISVGRMINARDMVRNCCLHLCKISYNRNDIETARKWAIEALTEEQHIGDRWNGSLSNCELGLIELRCGHIESADTFLSTAISKYTESQELDVPYFMISMAELNESKGNIDGAMDWYKKSVEKAVSKNDALNLASGLLGLGRATHVKGDLIEAKSCYTESLRVAQECGRTDIIAKAFYSIALLDFTQNHRQTSKSRILQALDLFRRLDMKREQAEAEALLAKLAEESAQ